MHGVRRALVALGALSLSHCSWSVNFTRLHPALINASRAGNTMQVLPLGGPFPQAAAMITADLQQRITQSHNRSIRLVAGGGGVLIGGAVLENSAGQNYERVGATCYHTESYNGQTRSVPHGCVTLRMVYNATAAIQFQVMDAAGNAIFSRLYRDQTSAVRTGREGPYPADNIPLQPLDPTELLVNLNSRQTDVFARVILPWTDVVNVPLAGCAGDARCRSGYDLLRSGGDAASAERFFDEVVRQFDRPGVVLQGSQIDRVAEALYNRGITRGFSGRYAEGVADLERALVLRPAHNEWRAQLAQVQTLAQEQRELDSQDTTRVQRQDVQSAGQP